MDTGPRLGSTLADRNLMRAPLPWPPPVLFVCPTCDGAGSSLFHPSGNVMVPGFELYLPVESFNQVSCDNTWGRPVLPVGQSLVWCIQTWLINEKARDPSQRDFHSGAFKNFWEEVFIQSLLHEAERLPMCRVMRCTKAHSWWSRFFRLEKSICGCPRTTLDNASNECVHPSTFSDIHAFLDS